MKKKICMIVQDREVKGGIAAVVNGYRGSWIEEEFKVTYLESYKDGNKWLKLLIAFKSYINFLKILINEKPSLIHIHSSFGASFYRKIPFIFIANLLKIPIINHIHGADFNKFYLEANNLKKKLIKSTYEKCEVLIALSDEWRINLNLIVPLDKIKVIQNYSITNGKAVRERKLRQFNKCILFLGEISKRKGCYDIPLIVEKVSEQEPNVKFILAGTGQITKLRDLLRKRNLEKFVEFPGWIRGEEKDQLLKQADIFFLPSYNEGMPMAILDAMGYGLPIISTKVGGIPKLVKYSENGFLCNPGDIEGFTNALLTLLHNEEETRVYGDKSYVIVQNKYSLNTHLKQLSQLYDYYGTL